MNTLRYALRFLLRARTYTLINLLGLAFSLACCIILLRYIHRELTVDTHCVDRENVYVSRCQIGENDALVSSTLNGDTLAVDPSLVMQRSRVTLLDHDMIRYKDNRLQVNMIVADTTFLKLFRYQLLQGEYSLSKPGMALLSEHLAHKLFGKQNPIGETFVLSTGKSVTVSGIFATPENKSILQVDAILSEMPGALWERMPMEFVRFVPGADIQKLNEAGKILRPTQVGDGSMYTFSLLSLKDVYWESRLLYRTSPTMCVSGNRAQLYVLSVMCIFIFFIGLLNYINLYAVLFVLAIFDLVVGVSNDAVNFLQSAVGAKAASFKTILFIAGIGVFIGAALSNGMMDIARHGIYQPEHFYFAEIMCILLAVMLTDVVLLDVFNTMGMPTSTTVSMVFELLGGTFALALIKVYNSDTLGLGDLINTDKALSVIMAIFVSVAIAFFFGMLVQWLARIVFTFNYKKNMKYSIALFGGIAATSIIYFMLIKGLKDSSFMTPENKQWIHDNTALLITGFFVFFTILMQILHWCKINVFKVVVLMGTFALALAFAGNDLVNFIGVPLAGYSSFIDYTANGTAAGPDGFLMSSLLGAAKTPWYFLIGAGAIMVYALCTSKKAHNVIKTSVDLARQDDGEENFGSTPIARTLVRFSMTLANGISKTMPESSKRWMNTRFQKDEAIIADGAAFDLVRASVNLVLAGLLIALGTSLKLPLSTTYVTFMVAMGTSLADRAWGRDSAVFRITGVLSVIGGWFITAGAAFTICFFVALIIHFGGTVAILALIGLAVFMLIRSQVMYKKRKEKEKGNETLKQLMKSTDNNEVIELLRKHTREELVKIIEFTEENFERTVTSFLHENLRGLRRAMGSVKFEKQLIKQMKRTGTLAMCRLDNNTVLEKGLYYYQGNDFASELVYSVGRLCEPCLEHIDNNFNPLDAIQKGEFTDVAEDICYLLQVCRHKLETNNYDELETEIRKANDLNGQLSHLKREELQRIQSQSGSIKVSMVYLTMIQEAQNVVTYTINLMKVSRKFQVEKEEL